MGRAKRPLAVLVVQARIPKPRPLLYYHDADPSSRSKKTAKILHRLRYNCEHAD